jgi:hypothetical protein
MLAPVGVTSASSKKKRLRIVFIAGLFRSKVF